MMANTRDSNRSSIRLALMACVALSCLLGGCHGKIGNLYTVDQSNVPRRISKEYAEDHFYLGRDYPTVVVRGYKSQLMEILILDGEGKQIDRRSERIRRRVATYEFTGLERGRYTIRLMDKHHRVRESWGLLIE